MMSENSKNFLMSEYRALREEILESLGEIPKNERLALVLCAAFWAWLVSNTNTHGYIYVAVWVPAALTYLLRKRAIAFDKKFEAFRVYLLKVEEQFNLEGLGWEHFLEDYGSDWFSASARPFWKVLFWGNIVFAIIAVIAYAI